MNISKRSLFRAYNQIRHTVCPQRAARALGYIQARRVTLNADGSATVAGADERPYTVTRDGCNCPDHYWRRAFCKHMVARQMMLHIQQA